MDDREIINIIPSKDISFKTRSLLSQILSRLELTNQDRLDLEKYITFGGGENLDIIKDNLSLWLEWKDKILNIIKDAPEEYDTLIEIFNYIEQHIQDAPFEKGSSENSAVLKGGDNVAGLKGFYVNAINENKIYISELNTEISENIPLIDEQFDNPYAVGDEYSLQLGEIYYNLGVITFINHNLMVVSNLKPIKYDDRLRYYFYVLSKPSLGVVDLGLYTSTLGFENSANDFCAHSEGWKNKSIGKYSHTEGKENEAHYCAHAEGSNNIASGNTSHAEGTDNRALNSNTHVEGRYTSAKGYASHAEGQGESLTNPNLAEGNYSHVEGEKTKSKGIASHSEGMLTEADGKAAHAEGRQTKTTNDYTHAEGYLSEAGGIGSHAEGVGTQTKNNGEHAEGRFNKSNSVAPNEGSNPRNTLHSVGIGTSDAARKNAHEIMQDGKHYIYGVGSYVGTNPQPGVNDLATILNSPITDEELNELFNE